jgi:hypothetical protein
MLGYTDVHRDGAKAFKCVNCHAMSEVHGDGSNYNSMFDGAIKIDCTDCHPLGGVPTNAAHDQHRDNIHCSACHVQATVSCYSCHFESEVNLGAKIPYGVFDEWKFLLKWKGKAHQANIQSLTYGGEAFVGIAPFYGHSVHIPDINTICDQCHNNALVNEYNLQGTMTATWWDTNPDTIRYFKGMIPVPPDWRTALKFAFATKDTNGKWIALDDDDVTKQMIYGEPLDALPPQDL